MAKAMFKSVSMLESNAKALLLDYHKYVNATLNPILDGTEDIFHAQFRSVSMGIANFVKRANDVLADPDFGSLSLDLQDDVTAIAQEGALAQAHVDSTSDPDKVWSALPPQTKQDATQRQIVDKAARDVLRARLRMETRAQGGGPPPKK